jgi:hypothetical protein
MAVKADLRDKVEADILKRPEVSSQDMMGTKAYLVRGRMFAYWVPDGLVAKLPDHARQEFLDRMLGAEFQGPAGRSSGDWMRLALGKKADVEHAIEGAKQAYEFARGATKPRAKRGKRK